jgi:hypothetical protein
MPGVASAVQGFIAAAMFGAGIGGPLTLLPIVFADYYRRNSYGCDPEHRAVRSGPGPGRGLAAVGSAARPDGQL